MRRLRELILRLGGLFNKQHKDRELDEEIESHLQMNIEDNLRLGMTPEEARRQAMIKLGGIESTKEAFRDQRGLPFMETLAKDTRHALRRLRMAPVFTITTMLILALGIGATTSIFTLVHAVLLKSLPVANPGELYRLGREARCCYFGGYIQDKEFSLVYYDLYKYLRDNTKGFAELAAFPPSSPLFGVRR